MLRDLTKDDWISILGIPESRIPKALVLRGTRNLQTHYRAYRSYFNDKIDITSSNGVVEDVFIGDIAGYPVAYASVYGAPMASEVTHICGVLGTPLVIQTGCCGAIADGMGAGDLFIAEEAYCGEGASQYYVDESKTVGASPEVIDILRTVNHDSLPLHSGRIYTTSALFAEGEEDIENWFQQGFSAVDMETSATFAVAESFGMDRLSILFAFDNPRAKEHIFAGDDEKNRRCAEGNRRMIDLALETIKEYVGRKL